MQAVGLIVAAGLGHRLGTDIPKTFLPLGGAALFLWPLRAFERTEEVIRTLLVVAPGYEDQARQICRQDKLHKLSQVVAGGPTRPESVYNGLNALKDQPPDIVAIHDGARPFVTPQLIARTIDACAASGAAIAALPATDTLKQVDDNSIISATIDRRPIHCAQTPQTFEFNLILQAYQQFIKEGGEATDDAALVEKMGHPVKVVEGSPHNFKITTPADWQRAENMMGSTQQIRVGHGYDVHPLVKGRPLILGGVTIDYQLGLAGYSDADVVLHALADALLGATGLGDIGQYFPDTDPTFKDADSKQLLGQIVELIHDAGYQPINVDVTILAQQPHLAPYIDQMRQQVASILDIGTNQVSIKATTTEGLGFIGRQEAIAAHAVALIGRRPL